MKTYIRVAQLGGVGASNDGGFLPLKFTRSSFLSAIALICHSHYSKCRDTILTKKLRNESLNTVRIAFKYKYSFFSCSP